MRAAAEGRSGMRRAVCLLVAAPMLMLAGTLVATSVRPVCVYNEQATLFYAGPEDSCVMVRRGIHYYHDPSSMMGHRHNITIGYASWKYRVSWRGG